MAKQKLPTGWAYDEFDHAYNDNIDDDLSTVQVAEGKVSIGEDDSSSAPAAVVLAVIRNAGLEPVVGDLKAELELACAMTDGLCKENARFLSERDAMARRILCELLPEVSALRVSKTAGELALKEAAKELDRLRERVRLADEMYRTAARVTHYVPVSYCTAELSDALHAYHDSEEKR